MNNKRPRERKGTAAEDTARDVEVLITDHLPSLEGTAPPRANLPVKLFRRAIIGQL